ncbi:hypothetical protein E3N88_25092 [Mikania micrantha]|uniref:60S ribosomal protein L13 n=1 Tax=Mikania micrantha TaxID=192012 RepID=A0A5N6N406_9ASTR|nr:hypothetical protein E3N88_25092 [Mikania micrantha]
MVKHNNVIPNGHFKKHWQNYVRTWFNQPARKTRRRNARQAKAVKDFPRPAGKLRPQVHGQTLKYNMKLREGRGFSLEELKAAGIPKKLAPTIGIAVDHRRRNRSLEGLQANVQRLKTFKAKLVVFPRRARKMKAGDSTPEELATATQVQGPVLPIVREKAAVEFVKVTDEMKSFNAYSKLRIERTNKKHLGARLKRAAEAEKEEKKVFLSDNLVESGTTRKKPKLWDNDEENEHKQSMVGCFWKQVLDYFVPLGGQHYHTIVQLNSK